MTTDRQFVRLHWFVVPCLIICLTSCDNPKKGQSTDAIQKQSDQPSQTATPNRAPRTLKAFQKAIEDGQVGTISGRALFNGHPPTPKELPVTLNKSVCGREPKKSESLLVSEGGGIQSVVVSLLNIPRGLPMDIADPPPKLDQQKCVFIPHVLIVPADTEFEVLNSDPVMHNFHATGAKNPGINVNQRKTKNKQLPVKFPHPEIMRVVCDVHSWMQAWIVVAEHPYYALTDEGGLFRLENVPAGSYQIKIWHEELGEQIKEVTVVVNQDAVIAFEFSQQ